MSDRANRFQRMAVDLAALFLGLIGAFSLQPIDQTWDMVGAPALLADANRVVIHSSRADWRYTSLVPSTLSQFVLYFLKLGTFGFGGPIALAGYMQRDLVERRRWLSKQDYVEGLALAQLAPGPLAAQLAIYLGWVKGRIRGATLVGLAFVLPSFVMVLALSATAAEPA